MKPLLILTLALAVLAAPSVLAADEQQVTIEDLKYKPAEIKVKVGDTVVWTNNDDREHTVTAEDGSFKSGRLRSGKVFKFTFKKAGRFPYKDDFFARMSGVVVVAEKGADKK